MDFQVNNILVGGSVFVLSFVMLLTCWSLVIRTLFSLLGKSKLYFIPRTLKELFLSIAFAFLLISTYISIMFVDRTILFTEFFKVWQILLIFSLANIFVRVLLSGLDIQHKKARDRSGIYRSISLLKGTVGLALYFIAVILAINVISTELGIVITAIMFFIMVLLFLASYEQIKSIMSGWQLGDYYIEYGKLIKVDGNTGFIEAIYGRSTVLKTIHGKLIVIPNSVFFSRTFEISPDDRNEITLSAGINRSNPEMVKDRINAISSRIAISITEIQNEFKPKVFISSIEGGTVSLSIVLTVHSDVNIEQVVDTFCIELNQEFKNSVSWIRLEM